MRLNNIDIQFWNKELRYKHPYEIIDWALQLTDKRIITTSFGKYSAVLLNAFYKKDKNIDVIWCDTGFNLPETQEYAILLIEKFQLNMHVYTPLLSKKQIEYKLGIPTVSDPNHKEFTEIVKLEPFRRAIAEHKPEVWFTNLRVDQTDYRDAIDILSKSKEGIIKISPFYYWIDMDLDEYLKANNLPKNNTYFDPVKAFSNRECGIHFQ